jgi:hypothetical protein
MSSVLSGLRDENEQNDRIPCAGYYSFLRGWNCRWWEQEKTYADVRGVDQSGETDLQCTVYVLGL